MTKQKIELNSDNSIGGFLKKEIREAYFRKKLPQFLLEFQSSCSDIEEIEKLKLFLVEQRQNEDKLIKEMVELIGEENMGVKEYSDAPLAKFMGEMTGEEKESFEKWSDSCQKAISIVKGIISKTRNDLKTKAQLKNDDWLNMALDIATLMRWVDEDRVYKEQMYRKALMTEKAKRNCSRIEAEEITKTTQEYRDYKLAILFKENLEEFIMLCKKRGSIEYN